MSYDFAIDAEQLRRGSLILFKGRGHVSEIVTSVVTLSSITHVGILEKHKGKFYIIDANTQQGNDIHKDYLSGKIKSSGVMMIPLKQRLKTFVGSIHVRPLNMDLDSLDVKITPFEFYKKYQNVPYEKNLLELLNAEFKFGIHMQNLPPSLESVFCSELIAQYFIDIGWLNKRPVSKFWVPRQFESIQIQSKKYKYLNKLIRLL